MAPINTTHRSISGLNTLNSRLMPLRQGCVPVFRNERIDILVNLHQVAMTEATLMAAMVQHSTPIDQQYLH